MLELLRYWQARIGAGALGTALQVVVRSQRLLSAHARPFFSVPTPLLEVQLAAHFDCASNVEGVQVTQQMLVEPAQSESSSQAKPSPIGHWLSAFVQVGKGKNALKQHVPVLPEHASCAEH